MDDSLKNITDWLQHRIPQAESKDAHLHAMKVRINEITESIKDASEDELANMLKQQTEAINELIKHVSK